ncbi:hypothetical protein EV385_1763 [Krasilnikovia cinnamomea]|uniref:Thrombospondin n=1 Tax=Krasilnikovia cinnamomea TaxID=349313 RepID=A0A4Q7ZHU6_9ACTN|nr:hypothetical protein [Krasilnikovia cinnamomea]RZU50004.1 hypothetical protein EV385_1763 [Krasilnikovia cinnamomea]
MKIPTFTRHPHQTTDDEPRGSVAAPTRRSRDVRADETPTERQVRPRGDRPTADVPAADRPGAPRTGLGPAETDGAATRPAATPRPRASLLATLGLIVAVGAALLVLSGPLVGYGIGLAGLALVLSLAGFSATGKRHVAGKTDALIGMCVALGAIVVGVLALTGSLPWLGTDTQPVSNLREWLDAQFANRF